MGYVFISSLLPMAGIGVNWLGFYNNHFKTIHQKRKASSAAIFKDMARKIRHTPAGLIYCVFSCLCPTAAGGIAFFFFFTVFLFLLEIMISSCEWFRCGTSRSLITLALAFLLYLPTSGFHFH